MGHEDQRTHISSTAKGGRGEKPGQSMMKSSWKIARRAGKIVAIVTHESTHGNLACRPGARPCG